jgi:hypothetical protein
MYIWRKRPKVANRKRASRRRAKLAAKNRKRKKRVSGRTH